jgi:HD-GYP domain-containing protein (c-di-GMP phosphodiesterase class II)
LSHALLISSNEVICNLYEINMRAYVGTNISIKEDYDSAKALLEHAPDLNAVLVINNNESDQAQIQNLETFMQENSIKAPLIIVGPKKGEFNSKLLIKNKYDIRSILQTMAKILEITAKEMAQRPVPKFFPIPIRLIKTMEETDCDIYYRNQGDDLEVDYFKIIEKDSEIGDKINKYLDQGVKELFVDSQFRLKFINKASAAIINELNNEDTTTDEKIEIISQGQGLVAEDIYESEEISEEVAKISETCIQAIHETVKDVPKVKSLLAMLVANKADYVYKHSVLATYFANKIIDNISWGSKEQQEKVAFAFFFHDLFLVPILKKHPKCTNEEDLLFDESVSDEDKETVLDHAKMAGQLVKTFPKCPMGADMIITQHHGMTSGKGFAANYKDDISPLSKIMIISESIASFILTKLEEGDKTAITDKEGILRVLLGRYRSHTYKKIIEAFAEIDL